MEKEEVKEWLCKAEEHQLLVQYLMGTFYEFGLAGVEQDYEKAIAFYEEVARLGGMGGKAKVEELRASQCIFCGKYKSLEVLNHAKICKSCGKIVK